MQSDNASNAVRLGDYFALLRRQWFTILVGVAVGVALALAYLQWAPREYTSQTSVLVTATNAASVDAGGGRTDPINLDTEAQLVTSTETVSAAAELLDISPADIGDLGDQVTVTVPPNTEILDIAFVGSTAEEAQRGARAFAEAYLAGRQATAEAALQARDEALQDRIDAVTEELRIVTEAVATLPNGTPERARAADQAAALNQQLASLGSQQNQVRAETVSPGRVVTQAPLPAAPSSPDRYITLAAGVVLGLLLGLGVAALRHRADDCIRRPEDLTRRTGVAVATVLQTRLHEGEVSLVAPLSADGRAYARLRNMVTTSLAQTDRRVVLVAGVHRGGGPVAANLAASLARAGEDVYLVCADVFGTTANALLAEPPTAGLAEVLAGERQVSEVVHRLASIPTLRVLGPGNDPDRADALLQTRSPRRLVDRLLKSASYVVIEAPSTTDSSDAQTLANVAELAVVVVEAGRTTARDVVDALGQFGAMHTPVLGAVFGQYGRDGDARGHGGELTVAGEGRPVAADAPSSARPGNDRPGPAGEGTAASGSPAGSVLSGSGRSGSPSSETAELPAPDAVGRAVP